MTLRADATAISHKHPEPAGMNMPVPVGVIRAAVASVRIAHDARMRQSPGCRNTRDDAQARRTRGQRGGRVHCTAHVSRTPCCHQAEGDDHSKTPHHMLPQHLGQVRLSPTVWTARCWNRPPRVVQHISLGWRNRSSCSRSASAPAGTPTRLTQSAGCGSNRSSRRGRCSTWGSGSGSAHSPA
jgi:hypothetical protein